MLLLIFSFIAQFDTYSHTAYFDRAQFTYGYGTKGARHARVSEDVARSKAMEAITKHLRIVDELPGLNSQQKTALTSFSYNVGDGAFRQSALYRLVKRGEICRARHEFPKWIYQSGRKLDGLVKRRLAERNLFLQGVSCGPASNA